MFMGVTPTILRPLSLVSAILKPQDVFATSLFAGPDTVQTDILIPGVDLTQGGMVWGKARGTAARNHEISDTLRGPGKGLYTNTTGAEAAGDIGAFGNGKFTIVNSSNNLAFSGRDIVTWAFRRAAKFFDTNVFTHVNGTPTNIDLSSLGIVGDVVVKRRDAAGDWYAWHRSLTAGNNLRLNTTDAQSTTNAFISVSGTTLTFSASAPSGNYSYKATAHDPSADGIVQCGSFTEGASLSARQTIALGWVPQFILMKMSSQSNGLSGWYLTDTARGLNSQLSANTSEAETSRFLGIQTVSNGFTMGPDTFGAGATIIYLAIRAPY